MEGDCAKLLNGTGEPVPWAYRLIISAAGWKVGLSGYCQDYEEDCKQGADEQSVHWIHL